MTEGLLCNLTNPKAFGFFISIYSQATRPDLAPVWRVLLPATVVVHAIVCWSLIVLAVQSAPVASRLRSAQRHLPRAFGLALLAFAAWVGWGVLRELG